MSFTMRNMVFIFTLLIMHANEATANETPLPPAFVAEIEAATGTCASFADGTFRRVWHAVDRRDLDGDLVPDLVLNESGFHCSTAPSLFCGSGGCITHVLVGDTLSSRRNQGWDLSQVDPHMAFPADVHGTACGGIGPTPCVVASIRDANRDVWRTASAVWE